MARIGGVDPGAHGALALLVDGVLTDTTHTPVFYVRRGKTDKAEVNGAALAALFREWRLDIAVIERVGGIPGQSASASFNFGRAAGVVEGVLHALGVRVDFVSPPTWRRGLHINPGKDGSRESACRFWPARQSDFARVKDTDRAEAALIALWRNQQADCMN